MKNSTKTYLLLFAVLSIWGTIAFKAIAGLNPIAPEAKEEGSATFFVPSHNLEMDTFSIQKTERDPFLGSFATTKKHKTTSPKSNSISKKIDDNPSISYLGSIQKKESQKEIFIIKINNDQYLLKQGETIQNVKLLKGNQSSIIVKNHHKRQTILIE